MPQTLPDVPAPPRRKRRLRLLFAIVVLLAMLIALAPSALSALARSRIGPRLSRQLGTPCRIEKASIGWLSGLEFGEIEIGNAPGFDRSHPLLRAAGGHARISLLRMLGGNFDVQASVRGLQLWLDEDATGHSNLERLLATTLSTTTSTSDPASIPRPRAANDPATGGHDEPSANGNNPAIDGDLLRRLRLDLSLRDAGLELRRAGELVETVAGIDFAINKDAGDGRFRTTLDAVLPATDTGGRAGAIHLDADYDGEADTADGTLRARRFDVGRYQPLLRAMLAPGELTALAGVLDGDLTFRFDPTADPRFTTSGDLTVTEPRLSGSLLQGIDLRAARWTFQPQVAVRAGAGNALGALTATGTHLDLGFLQLDAIDAVATDAAIRVTDASLAPDAATAGADSVHARFALDLAALAQLGGPFAAVPEVGGQLRGTFALPRDLLEARGAEQAFAALRQLRGIVVDARLEGARGNLGGFALTDGSLGLTLTEGRIAIASAAGTTLNGGPLELRLSADASADPSLPFEATLRWNGGTVGGDAAHLLRYAVPVLAGLGAEAGAFSSRADLNLSLRGPATAAAGESVLQWLDRFEGSGDVTLRDGSLAPAGQLQGLLTLLGQSQRLSLDHLAGAFTMHQGTISTKAMRWLSKGKDYGLSGSTHLDGRLDFGIDVTALLQQHRDGKQIAALLGNTPLVAGLAGTLDAPTLGMPDLAKLTQQALEQAPRRLLEQQGQDLLKKGLDELFGGKKKK